MYPKCLCPALTALRVHVCNHLRSDLCPALTADADVTQAINCKLSLLAWDTQVCRQTRTSQMAETDSGHFLAPPAQWPPELAIASQFVRQLALLFEESQCEYISQAA